MTPDDRSLLPFQNGIVAAEAGKDRVKDNPYALHTPNSDNWLAGFDDYVKPDPAPKTK